MAHIPETIPAALIAGVSPTLALVFLLVHTVSKAPLKDFHYILVSNVLLCHHQGQVICPPQA